MNVILINLMHTCFFFSKLLDRVCHCFCLRYKIWKQVSSATTFLICIVMLCCIIVWQAENVKYFAWKVSYISVKWMLLHSISCYIMQRHSRICKCGLNAQILLWTTTVRRLLKYIILSYSYVRVLQKMWCALPKSQTAVLQKRFFFHLVSLSLSFPRCNRCL